MSKRLNPHRRLLAKQAALIREQKQVQSATHGAEMAKLQQGVVRSHTRDNPASATYRAPNWTSDDKAPKRGKVVKGNFVPKRLGQKVRFSTK